MDQEQWTEIEGDAKKLHELVQTQRNQINEIASLISQTGLIRSIFDRSMNSFFPATIASITKTSPSIPSPIKPPRETANTTAINTLLQKSDTTRKSLSQQQQQRPVTTIHSSNMTLVNPSPGTSPTHSMTTLLDSIVTHTIVNEPEEKPPQPQPTVGSKKPIVEQPHVPIDIPLVEPKPAIEEKPTIKRPPSPVPPPRQPDPPVVEKKPIPKPTPSPIRPPQPPPPAPAPPVEPKKCPVCHYQFPSTTDDLEMYDHIDKCLFPTANNTPPKDYECPNCKEKFSSCSDKDYLQHLTDCYNREY